MVITPITLTPRDGLRVVQAGHLPGDISYVHQQDPDHIAFVLAERVRRDLLQDLNYRRFG